MSELAARIVPVERISEVERRQMYTLFERYYDAVSYAQFCRDLAAKDEVIVLRDASESIKGFSTLLNVRLDVGGRVHHGLFSGDTVIDRAFWGQKALGVAFLKYLFLQKVRHPFRPFYWFLISKGYKTYLLMANNFSEHYPNVDRETPAHARALLDAFGEAHYPDAYDPAAGLIRFDRSHGHLKQGVAAITPRELEDRKIAFFQRLNPTWSEGTEVCCLARMTWGMPVYYALKKQWRRVCALAARLRRPKPQPALGRPALPAALTSSQLKAA